MFSCSSYYTIIGLSSPSSCHSIDRLKVSLILHCLQWYPELSDLCPTVPIVLVGTKLDLRDGSSTTDTTVVTKTDELAAARPASNASTSSGSSNNASSRRTSGKTVKPGSITILQGLALAGEVHAYKYVECSAKSLVGLEAVFDAAIRSVIYPRPPKSEERNDRRKLCCCLL